MRRRCFRKNKMVLSTSFFLEDFLPPSPSPFWKHIFEASHSEESREPEVLPQEPEVMELHVPHGPSTELLTPLRFSRIFKCPFVLLWNSRTPRSLSGTSHPFPGLNESSSAPLSYCGTSCTPWSLSVTPNLPSPPPRSEWNFQCPFRPKCYIELRFGVRSHTSTRIYLISNDLYSMIYCGMFKIHFNAYRLLVYRFCSLVVFWVQIHRSGFDSRRHQIFGEVVVLEWGPLNLVSTTEELLGRKSNGSDLETREYGRRVRSRWPCGTLYPQKLTVTSPKSGDR
jgi:hypothetical protein